ncbi:MAG: DUF1207 domain-containing protein [Chrysiogenetes bacterium]|nr:DUF1207 domain-containing protein [Chrysiogenetes bacterium]
MNRHLLHLFVALFSAIFAPALARASAISDEPRIEACSLEEEADPVGDPAFWALPAWVVSEDACGPEPGEEEGITLFQSGNLFDTVLANPREVRAEAAVGRLSGSPTLSRLAGSHDFYNIVVWMGGDFPLVRRVNHEREDGRIDGHQIGIMPMATVLLSFSGDFGGDLVNADFNGGLYHSYRKGPLSLRTRFYHESTHLGDEFIQITNFNPNNRINLSFEALEFLASYDLWDGRVRVYGGPEFKVRVEPSAVKRWEGHVGMEWRPDLNIFVLAHPVIGVDVNPQQTHDGKPTTAVVAGLEIGKRRHHRPRVKLLARYLHGPSPYGQFRITDPSVDEFLVSFRWSQ